VAFDESLAHLLEERRIATLTTYSEDGLPHVTAVWYLYEDGAIYIATDTNTSKGKNLQRDPRMAICIESREGGREAGLSACGVAQLLTGDEAAPIALRLNAKYLTDEAMAHPVVGAFFIESSNLVIKLEPRRWISWDMAALGEQVFGCHIEEAEFFKPLEI